MIETKISGGFEDNDYNTVLHLNILFDKKLTPEEKDYIENSLRLSYSVEKNQRCHMRGNRKKKEAV